jgi:hypothetical protein
LGNIIYQMITVQETIKFYYMRKLTIKRSQHATPCLILAFAEKMDRIFFPLSLCPFGWGRGRYQRPLRPLLPTLPTLPPLPPRFWPLLEYALQGKSHLCIPFLGMRGLSPNFHIHVSLGDLYIPKIGPHISLQQNYRQTDPGNIYKYERRNWETEH